MVETEGEASVETREELVGTEGELFDETDGLVDTAGDAFEETDGDETDGVALAATDGEAEVATDGEKDGRAAVAAAGFAEELTDGLALGEAPDVPPVIDGEAAAGWFVTIVGPPLAPALLPVTPAALVAFAAVGVPADEALAAVAFEVAGSAVAVALDRLVP